jgi:hypothetical protein
LWISWISWIDLREKLGENDGSYRIYWSATFLLQLWDEKFMDERHISKLQRSK